MNNLYHAELAGELRELMRRHETSLLEMCRQIYAEPELGLKEEKACAAQVKFLESAGFRVTDRKSVV